MVSVNTYSGIEQEDKFKDSYIIAINRHFMNSKKKINFKYNLTQTI